MEKVFLSKSTYIRSLQCSKSLYLYKKHYGLKDVVSEEKQAIFQRGINVGELAQKLFPGGKLLKPSHRDYNKGCEETREALKINSTVYEASFVYKGVYVAADIITKNEEGKWEVYEVKSSIRITQSYINDIALQYYVISNSGIDIDDICIVLLDANYIRGSELDLDKLFVTVSVKEKVLEMQEQIAAQVMAAKGVVESTTIPLIDIGEQCFSPYECDFRGFCWKDIPKDSVFDLAGISRKSQFELYRNGFTEIGKITDTSIFSKTTQTQIDALNKNEEIINKEGLKQFLHGINYPIYFLDFETFMPAVPYFEGTRPYQHIPFQYSLHLYENENGELQHKEFLAEPSGDPRIKFIENLIKDVKTTGTILVYNVSFERQILNDLIRRYPMYSEALAAIIARMVDLIIPFENKYYYHPAMRGSHSMKYVLPAIFPELSYKNLVIKSGAVAMMAFERLYHETDIVKICDTKDALKEYCKLDTLGMVKIFDFLKTLVKE